MRRSNKGHRDGAVQAAFETAPRVWVLCVKNAFLFAAHPFGQAAPGFLLKKSMIFGTLFLAAICAFNRSISAFRI